MTLPSAWLDDLRAIVGVNSVITDAVRQERYLQDWTGRYIGHSPAVVVPNSTEEVAKVLGLCRSQGIAWVPQGGNSGLVGGGVPVDGEVVLSTAKLRWLGPVDESGWQVSVGAGVTLAELGAHCAPFGLRYGVDFGAREVATIGGTIATNAGGTAVLRFGMTREQLCGIEAVLPNGTVVSRMSGLVKDNTGYDLANLLCGSEGTLGVITAARLRLRAVPNRRITAAIGVASIAQALDVFVHLRRRVELEQCEIMRSQDIGALIKVGRVVSCPASWLRSWCLLVEVIDTEDDATADALIELVDVVHEDDVVIAPNEGVRQLWWGIREAHPELARSFGEVLKLDVTVPLTRLGEFVDVVDSRVALVSPQASTVIFGHLGDGNLHVNVGGQSDHFGAIESAVLGFVLELGGSVSAEHGIGRLKREWLERDRGPSAVAAMRAIKGALDPDRLANPNVLL